MDELVAELALCSKSNKVKSIKIPFDIINVI